MQKRFENTQWTERTRQSLLYKASGTGMLTYHLYQRRVCCLLVTTLYPCIRLAKGQLCKFHSLKISKFCFLDLMIAILFIKGHLSFFNLFTSVFLKTLYQKGYAYSSYILCINILYMLIQCVI